MLVLHHSEMFVGVESQTRADPKIGKVAVYIGSLQGVSLYVCVWLVLKDDEDDTGIFKLCSYNSTVVIASTAWELPSCKQRQASWL